MGCQSYLSLMIGVSEFGNYGLVEIVQLVLLQTSQEVVKTTSIHALLLLN